ncbi:MAG: 4-hydroxythreonine-4-phosphate dehydrogenase PdxA [Myxococcota bacterium]
MLPIGVTVGDPAGIGPEVVERAIEETDLRAVIYGAPNVAGPLAARLGVEAVCTGLEFSGPVGEPTAESGASSLQALMTAIDHAREGRLSALCTAPISKEALHFAGSKDRGHTEILARELGTGPTAMAFFGEKIRCALVTTHLPLRRAVDALTGARVIEVAVLLDAALRALGEATPKLALAALNPHAGEAGLLGTEEVEILAPAVIEARAAGVDLHGPLPADSVFRRALDNEFSGVVSLYHDQALIPLKLLGFGESTNVTLGLSVPRTSPDHGTAYDRVGTDTVSAEGMVAALRWAERLGATA